MVVININLKFLRVGRQHRKIYMFSDVLVVFAHHNDKEKKQQHVVYCCCCQEHKEIRNELFRDKEGSFALYELSKVRLMGDSEIFLIMK